MNEFTKDELDTLLAFLKAGMHKPLSHKFQYWDLSTKLQSIIDDYCEHKESKEYIVCEAGKFIKCETCSKFFKG
jgi:hypothetical protein